MSIRCDKPDSGRSKHPIITGGLTAFAGFLMYGFLSHFHLATKHFSIHTDRTDRSYTFVLLSDLHACIHGRGNRKLIRLIDKAHPDCILVAGDMVTKYTSSTDKRNRVVLRLLQELSRKYPVYYAPGNHEIRMKDTFAFYDLLRKMRIHLLLNQSEFFLDDNVRVWGLDIPKEKYRTRDPLTRRELAGFLQSESADPDCFNILLAHDPRNFDAYTAWNADLTVCGHLHGGVMRLPFVGGVLSPYLRLFPDYDAGIYTRDEKNMIVSRGLGSHHIKFRWFNPPELVVIHVNEGEDNGYTR